MSRSRKHFQFFEPHSRYKHLVLKTYFEIWGRKLLLGDSRRSRVVYVDACAGRGVDETGLEGSPVIAAMAAADAVVQLATLPGGAGKHIAVLAIEKEPKHFRALADNLAEFGSDVRAVAGTLGEHLPAIEREFGPAPTLYFIDPFGIEPLQADVVQRALAGPRNEVLLLFADRAALRHFGAAIATETAMTRRLKRRRAELSLFEEHDAEDLASLAPAAARSEEALAVTQERSIEILNAAFGSAEWRAAVAAAPSGVRQARLLALYRDLLASFGAPYVLVIPVHKATGEYAYSLVHASKSAHGRRAMKEAVAYALKHADFLPEEVRQGMRDAMSVDLSAVVQAVAAKWSGKEVRWTNEAAICLKYELLDDTDVWPFQLPELKQRLKQFRKPGRGPEVYAFPAPAS